MSRGNNLQEMESVATPGQGGGAGGGTSQSKTAVNANAKPAEAPGKSATPVTTPGQTASWEDLGGPTPENSKPDDNSNELKTPGATLKQVKDVVNAKAKPAEAPHKSATPVKEEEVEVEGEVVAESETEEEVSETQEVVAEEETTEEEVVEEETVEDDTPSIEEDIEALIAGEELSEEFQEKARTIFEAAIKTKVAEMKEEVQKQYEVSLTEEVANLKSELTERVDSYLEYVAQEWLTENQLAVEHGLKTEMTESFLTGMKSLFEEHYVEIPEEKYDVLESMVDKLDDMETKLNEQIEKNISLNKRLAESVADGIFESVSDGLAATQKEKLASLAESVEFESETEYREKLETLKESYFSGKAPVAKTETLSEGVDESPEFVSNTMDRYLRTMGSFGK